MRSSQEIYPRHVRTVGVAPPNFLAAEVNRRMPNFSHLSASLYLTQKLDDNVAVSIKMDENGTQESQFDIFRP